MMGECICESPNKALSNKHFDKKNTELILLKDSEGYSIVILENGKAISVFDINYCPKCGKDLKVRRG